MLNSKRMDVFCVRLKEYGFLLSPLLVNIVLEALARVTWKEKEMKGIQIRKEEMELYSLANDMNVSVKI